VCGQWDTYPYDSQLNCCEIREVDDDYDNCDDDNNINDGYSDDDESISLDCLVTLNFSKQESVISSNG